MPSSTSILYIYPTMHTPLAWKDFSTRNIELLGLPKITFWNYKKIAKTLFKRKKNNCDLGKEEIIVFSNIGFYLQNKFVKFWDIKFLKLLKRKYKIGIYFDDTINQYKRTNTWFWITNCLLPLVDYNFTYCKNDSESFNIPFVNAVFENFKIQNSPVKKYDLVMISTVLDERRAESCLKIFKNPKFSLLKSFLYAADWNGLLNKEEIICPQKSVDCKDYFGYTNTILFLKTTDKYFTNTPSFCIKNNIKLLTDCEFTYNLINDPKKVKLIKDWSNISDEDILWCKEVDAAPYNKEARKLVDWDNFGQRLLDAIK